MVHVALFAYGLDGIWMPWFVRTRNLRDLLRGLEVCMLWGAIDAYKSKLVLPVASC